MENITPQMTPEMMQQMQMQQPPMQQPPMQQPPMQQQMQQPQDEVAAAKQLLGLDNTEQQLSQMQATMEAMVQESVRSRVANKYKGVPYDIVEKEIAKVEAINPEFAKSMRTTEEGMEMAYRSAKSAIEPNSKPDNITDGGGGLGGAETLEENIRSGKADDFQLGAYILGANKK